MRTKEPTLIDLANAIERFVRNKWCKYNDSPGRTSAEVNAAWGLTSIGTTMVILASNVLSKQYSKEKDQLFSKGLDKQCEKFKNICLTNEQSKKKFEKAVIKFADLKLKAQPVVDSGNTYNNSESLKDLGKTLNVGVVYEK